ncbi:MAG: triose-phosphate isomerase [Bdellovibrionales bacterium]|nr:triose-phosphate isomerase [Bdellovibrionales bacterium]
MTKLLVANWKMNKNAMECIEFFNEFSPSYTAKREAWIAPQAIHLAFAIHEGLKKNIRCGSQNCSEFFSGAYTGELSPKNLKELGCHFVILGHSERRQYFHETSKSLNAKVKSALKEELKVVYCVGETLPEREANQTLSIVGEQIHQGLNEMTEATAENLIVAYEPVWAIGTGKTASPAQAQEVHAFIRSELKKKFPSFGDKIQLLYGGSVKPDNVEELLGQTDIDGGLVGGASLKARDFLALCGDK